MTMNELAAAVRNHAQDNYEVDGWDYIVECWESSEIIAELELEKITSESAAIAHFLDIAKIFDERRREVEAEIF